MKDKITKLTKLWYQLVSLDHHKDRDCHWYINTVYSYGEPPVYRLEHYGYIGGEISGDYDTYEKAELGLIAFIEDFITQEKIWAEEVLDNESEDWGEDQAERAKKIIEMLK